MSSEWALNYQIPGSLRVLFLACHTTSPMNLGLKLWTQNSVSVMTWERRSQEQWLCGEKTDNMGTCILLQQTGKLCCHIPTTNCGCAAVDRYEFTYAHMYETAFWMHEPTTQDIIPDSDHQRPIVSLGYSPSFEPYELRNFFSTLDWTCVSLRALHCI